MRTRNTFRPTLEGLESRWVPATIRLIGGSLFVSHQQGILTVETTPDAGKVRVTDAGKSVVVSGVGSLISITGTNLSNKINFLANGPANKAFPGQLLINSGNGNDTIDLSGRIGGNVTLLTGLGNDVVTSTGPDVDIGGGLTWTDPAGVNTLDMNSRTFKIGGHMTLNGVGLLTMAGGGGGGNTLRVGGTANILATQVVANDMALSFNGGDVFVGGTLNVVGGAADDTVTVSLVTDLTIGGNFWLTLRSGTNAFTLTPDLDGTGVNGSLSYTGGNDIDAVTVGANGDVAGNATYNLGNGLNAYGDDAGTVVAGSLALYGGNDTNVLAVNGGVAGDLTFGVGNGLNLATFGGVIGGRLQYYGGNGVDSLFITTQVMQTLVVDIRFGTGTSLLDLQLSANLALTGIVIGTGGNNTFEQGTAVLLPTLIFVNYP